MFPKDKDVQITCFWDKYIEKSKYYSNKPDVVRCYVKHAKLYIKAHSAQLKTHAARDVDKHLQGKGRNTSLKGWQFVILLHL